MSRRAARSSWKYKRSKEDINTIIIGIAGGTGSGKTTLTERLRDHFGIDEVSVINHDSYYKRHDELPYEERCKLNYDHPDSFDTPLMVAHLRELRAGHPVQVPVYDYTIHNRSNETVLVRPAPVIIVEGILIFDSPELCDLMDMKVFVDTDADVRILRRIVRDVKERGRTLDSVVTQYLTTVKPMHEQFVEPSKRKARGRPEHSGAGAAYQMGRQPPAGRGRKPPVILTKSFTSFEK